MGKQIDVSEYDQLCQVAQRRSGGPTMKQTRSDTEEYQFIGYLHR